MHLKTRSHAAYISGAATLSRLGSRGRRRLGLLRADHWDLSGGLFDVA